MWSFNRRSGDGLRRRATLGAAACRAFGALPAVCASIVAASSPVHAQSIERITGDSVVETDVFGGDSVSNRPQVVLDLATAVRIGDNWRIFARPWLRQARPATPTGAVPPWDIELYEAAVRYERAGPVAVRVDAGYIASPVGMGLFDWRPNTNPTILPHLGYVVPLVVFDSTLAVRPVPVANSYPLTGQLTLSAAKWDARVAILNSSPTRAYVLGNTGFNPKQTPNVVLGGGITPLTGLRFGASFTRGAYATADELTTRTGANRDATIAAGEGEFAFGYTSVRGEVVQTTFETAAGHARATEWFLQGTQILSARWFSAARVEHVAGPSATAGGAAVRTDLALVETTAGFRVNPEITIRASFYTRRFYGAALWDRQVGTSVVWSRRWW